MAGAFSVLWAFFRGKGRGGVRMLLGLRQGTAAIMLATQRLNEVLCREEYGVLPHVKTVTWEDSTLH